MDGNNNIEGQNLEEVKKEETVPTTEPVVEQQTEVPTPVAEPAPVETAPVETPAVETAPVAETAPVETPAVEPAPVAEPTPVETPAVETVPVAATSTETAPTTQAPVAETPKKKNNKPLIIGLLAVVVIAIAVVLCFVLGVFGGKKEEKKEEPKEAPEQDGSVTVDIDRTPVKAGESSDFNGFYQNGKTTLKIYSVNDEKVHMVIESEKSQEEANLKFIDGELSSDWFDDYRVELYKEGVGLYKEEEKEGTPFKKVRNYTVEEFYEDRYGEIKFLENGEYNYLYEMESGPMKDRYPDGKVIMYVYQQDNETLVMEFMIYTNYISEDSFEGLGNGNDIIENKDGAFISFFDEREYKFEGENLTVNNLKEQDEYSDISGTYKRVKQLTMQDIINEVTPMR